MNETTVPHTVPFPVFVPFAGVFKSEQLHRDCDGRVGATDVDRFVGPTSGGEGAGVTSRLVVATAVDRIGVGIGDGEAVLSGEENGDNARQVRTIFKQISRYL